MTTPDPRSRSGELAIAIVCHATFGGSGVIASELALGLARRGHAVHVVASAVPGRALKEHPRLQFHRVVAPSYPLFDHAPYTLALATAIAQLAREQRLDLVNVHYAVPHAASAYMARQLLGKTAPALVTTLHGTDVTRVGADAHYQEITRFCVESSDAISVPSAYLQREAHALLGIDAARPIEIIPNFVDTDVFCPPPARDRGRYRGLFASEDPAASSPVLFHASNFRAVKRVTDLLEVLARVRRSVPARLLLVGDGPERAAAVARARELGLEASVCFLGKRPDFLEELCHADGFLLSSETESFGLAALEALSCGVPVFGYRVGGLPSVVTEDTGRLVEPFDVDALARAVVDVVSVPDLRQQLGTAARARALASYRAEPALDRYERLFREAVMRRKSGDT